MRLKMASRKSDLARIQLHTVGEYLKKKLDIEPEFIYRESFGDLNLDISLSGSVNKGLFTQDFYEALVTKEVDLVVHSWKDLPIEDKETTIALTLEREDVRDLLLVKKSSLNKIKQNKIIDILTSSPRRECFLSHHLPNLYPGGLKGVNFTPIRGNIPTRLLRFIESTSDALVIAKAALDRMLSVEDKSFDELKIEMRKHLDMCQWMVLPVSLFPSAAAQGALAVEVLKGSKIESLLKEVNFVNEFDSVKKERQTLKKFGGGCHSKLGVNSLQRNYGEIFYFSHEVSDKLEQTQVLNRNIEVSRFEESLAWPVNGKVQAQRNSIEVDLGQLIQEQAIWVSKSSAFPEKFEPALSQVIWTSGLVSWQKLASRGIWVNGSAESLGEKEDMRLDILCGMDLSWCKLSHSLGVETDKKIIPTYEVEWSLKKEDLENKEHFYWMSGEMYKQACDVCPTIVNKNHYCGPGHTYDFLNKTVKNLTVCLGYKQWKKEFFV